MAAEDGTGGITNGAGAAETEGADGNGSVGAGGNGAGGCGTGVGVGAGVGCGAGATFAGVEGDGSDSWGEAVIGTAAQSSAETSTGGERQATPQASAASKPPWIRTDSPIPLALPSAGGGRVGS